MRFLLALALFISLTLPAFCADKAVEPSLIYDEILNASNYNLVDYNFPAGGRELNLFGLKNAGQYNINSVAAPDFEYLAYSEVYFYPGSRVTASALYLIKLEPSLSKKEAMLKVSTKDKERLPIIETKYAKLRPFKFNTFTVVDWNKNSDKILFKERLGKNYSELYLTKLYLYDLSTEKLVNLNLVRTKIIEYWQKKGLFLPDYKWDIHPLGFLFQDERFIAVNAYGYHGKERKFLGTWIINETGTKVFLHTLDKEKELAISSNGKCLKFIPDMGDIFKEQRKIDKKTKQRYIEPK